MRGFVLAEGRDVTSHCEETVLWTVAQHTLRIGPSLPVLPTTGLGNALAEN